jgi:Arm DNA-binding domain
MAGDRGRLTDLQIRHWVRAGVPMAKADGGGLTFTLSAGGATGWILRYSHGGRRRELTIGCYPDISLADARCIATIKRAEIMQGRNPAADKQKAKATAAKDWTVRELVEYRTREEAEGPARVRGRPRDASLDRTDPQRAVSRVDQQTLPSMARDQGRVERTAAGCGGMERIAGRRPGVSRSAANHNVGSVPTALTHLERIGLVVELTRQQPGRVFSYARYGEVLNEGRDLPGPGSVSPNCGMEGTSTFARMALRI